jgi:hypothetical protein
MQPLWFWLIRRWVETGKGDTGLTLPFLIGALWIEGRKAGFPGRRQLTDLLYAFQRHTPSTHVIRIGQCGNLGEPVAKAIPEDPSRRDPKEPMLSDEQRIDLPRGASRLYVRDYEHRRDMNSAAESLAKLVEAAFSDGRYSFQRGNGGRSGRGDYVPFTDEDQRFIEATKHERKLG